MKTIKKIIWMLLIIFIIYVVLVFIKPVLADSIAEKLGFYSFNEKLRIIKKGVDIASTKIPTKQEIEEAYSGAKDKVQEIKGNIDNIRNTADDLSKKYNEAKNFIDETGKKIDKVKDSLNDLQKVGEDISNVVNKKAIE